MAEPEFPGQFVMSLSVVLHGQVDKGEVDVGLCFRSTRVQRTKAESPVYLHVIRCCDTTALQLTRIDFGTFSSLHTLLLGLAVARGVHLFCCFSGSGHSS